MKPLQMNNSLPNNQLQQTSKLIQSKLGTNLKYKKANYITISNSQESLFNESVSEKGSLNDLQTFLQYIVKKKSVMSQLDFKENIQKDSSCKSIQLDKLTQTGNFGHPESQLSKRNSTQRTLPAFQNCEDLPNYSDLNKLQNAILDCSQLSIEYIDELKKLSAIILFRCRNHFQAD